MNTPTVACYLAGKNCRQWSGFKTHHVVPDDKSLPRKNFSELDQSSAEWKLLLEAYDKWDDLPDDDPRGPCISMQVHALYCDSGVHCTWAFLPWHRAFVYFHERTLGKLVGKPHTFRLPAWDWENFPKLPSTFNHSKLFAKDNYNPKPVLPNAVSATSLSTWLSSSRFEDFVGKAKGQANAFGSPHDSIHNRFSDAMGIPNCAAGEKIFYLHHVNVDRYWAYWWDFYVPKLESAENQFSPPPDYLAQTWVFYDENCQEVFVRAGDFVDPAKLGYSYTPPNLKLPSLQPVTPPLLPDAQKEFKISFAPLPQEVMEIDPAPVDAILDLDRPEIDLSHVNEVVLMTGEQDTAGEVVGYAVQFGHMIDRKNFRVRIGISKERIEAGRSSPVSLGVRQVSAGGVSTPITRVEAKLLQFYVPA